MADLNTQGAVQVGLWEWTQRVMVDAITVAVWEPVKPFRDAGILKAWNTFEANILNLSVFPMPWLFFPRLFRARELVAAAFISYMHNNAHEKSSLLVRMLYEHNHHQFGLGVEDIGRGQLGIAFAMFGKSAPCALWLLYHVFSSCQVLAAVRWEASAIARENHKDNVNSTFQETLRHRTISPGIRKVLRNVLIDEQFLLTKGMILATVQHSNIEARGPDAREFHYARFMHRGLASGFKRPDKAAFRAFGGGHDLCPGRHFASFEIMP
ncbi:Abscisic acid 8'-hydroxylase 4 [Metarhizium anisopliae]|nr:Abscisic acid 8'-hydroxylase 4 [Metarhizium anisopliae]